MLMTTKCKLIRVFLVLHVNEGFCGNLLGLQLALSFIRSFLTKLLKSKCLEFLIFPMESLSQSSRRENDFLYFLFSSHYQCLKLGENYIVKRMEKKLLKQNKPKKMVNQKKLEVSNSLTAKR